MAEQEAQENAVPLSAEAIREVCAKHRKWYYGAEGGERANLGGANLRGANLGNYSWETYLSEVVPALLTAGGKALADVANATVWECHTWTNCPMAAAFDVHDLSNIPALYRNEAETFIRFFDAKLIPLSCFPQLAVET